MKLALPALASLALIAATPAPQPSAAPIAISACRAKLAPSPTESSGPDRNGKYERSESVTLSQGDGLTVNFTNTARVAATEVDVRFGTASRTITTVQDKGTFAPETLVKHRFALPKHVSILGLGDATCTVTRVLYADGSSWPH